MARKSGRFVVILTWAGCLWASTFANAAPGCPFCPPSAPTLSEQRAESDRAALVEWVKLIPAMTEEQSPKTVFRVIDDLIVPRKSRPTNETITVDYERRGQPGDQFYILGKQADDGISWGLPEEVSEISFAYIQQAPGIEQPSDERLRYFLKFLEFSDNLVANDAFAEFSRAGYEDVVRLSSELPREKLRQWLQSEKTAKNRLGFYGMLLGLCGSRDDAEFLATRIFRTPEGDEVRIGVDGMMGGYVLLQGAEGLRRITAAKLDVAQPIDTEVYSVINALRFLWEYAVAQVPRSAIAEAMQSLLKRPKFAEIAVVDLSRWKTWGVTTDVLALYGKPPFDDISSKLKLVQFARACVKDAGESPSTSATAIAAQQFLKHIEQSDPETWRVAERLLSPRPNPATAAPGGVEIPPPIPRGTPATNAP